MTGVAKMWAIARPIGGVTLNGDEYLTDESGRICVFDSKEKARTAVAELFTDSEAEAGGVHTAEIIVTDKETAGE